MKYDKDARDVSTGAATSYGEKRYLNPGFSLEEVGVWSLLVARSLEGSGKGVVMAIREQWDGFEWP